MLHAAVLNNYGQTPFFGQLAKPEPRADQVLLKMEAASIKQLDKLKASGKHYTRYASFPTAVGVDGVGRLESGERYYAMGVSGMLAEYALANKNDLVPVPESLSASLAAVLPNALLGSDAALMMRGQFKRGQTIYINGATGVSGRMAVQAAKIRGAGRIIVSGRNAESLEYLKQLGADECISLLASPEKQLEQLVHIQQQTPIDLVLDYLWGQPLLTLLQAFAQQCPQPVSIITIGQMAGANIELPSGILRSKPITLLGSGLGSISKAELRHYNQTFMVEMLEKAAQGELVADYEEFALADIEQAWQTQAKPGSRVVVTL